jgi:ribosomal protein L18E
VAINGKVLGGVLDTGEKQNLILAVVHYTREVVAKIRQCGDKSSETPVVRALLTDNGLENRKVRLNAHHFNPVTMAQIHQAGSLYLTQSKENSSSNAIGYILFEPLAKMIGQKNAHGCVTTHRAHVVLHNIVNPGFTMEKQ